MDQQLQIGILEAGKTPDALIGRHGRYPAMFERLLRSANPALSFKSYAVIDGEVPDDARLADAWLITGSRHGVYERLAWMAPLEALIRKAVAAERPVVGICFGHQIVASALGGRVAKSDKGWGVGIHEYEIVAEAPWLAPRPATRRFAINAVHQDQVIAPPEGARVLARSSFCPYAALAYGRAALTFQGHPEFDNAFARDLLETRLKARIPPEVMARALGSFERAPQSGLVARWIANFLMANVRHRPEATEAEAAGITLATTN